MELAPHVSNPGFGLDVDFSTHLMRCLAASFHVKEEEAMASSDIQLWLRERYETDYRIYNHDTPPTPDEGLDLVRAFPMEDTYKHGPLYDRVVKFYEGKIHQRFGISFTELLSLPREVVSHILEITTKPPADEQKIITDLNDAFKNAGR